MYILTVFANTKIHFRLIALLIMKTLITLMHIIGRMITKRHSRTRLTVRLSVRFGAREYLSLFCYHCKLKII